MSNTTYQFKLVLLGEAAVGKSSLVLRFVKGHFSEYQESTIGAAFMTQTLALDDQTVKFEIWDTAGQERYHSLAPMYYRGAQAAVVVYDVTSKDSFDRATRWIGELKEQANKDIVIALAGNKVDLCQDDGGDDEGGDSRAGRRQVDREDAQEYANKDEKKLIFFETSAKTGENVNDVFVKIAEALPKVSSQTRPGRPGRPGVDLTQNSGGEGNPIQKCCN